MSIVGDIIEGAVDLVGNVIESVGDVAQDIIDVAGDVIQSAMDTISSVVENALKDPLGTLASIATAVYAPYLLPVVNAARVVMNGGDLGDALKSAAISYVAGSAGNYVGSQIGTALEYGTDIGSAQSAMLAAQSGDMLGGTWSGTIGNLAGGATTGAATGLLTGNDPIAMALNAFGNAAINLGTNYAMNSAGQLFNAAGDLISDTSSTNEITNPAQEGEFGYGYRYFSDGTVIDPFGNYFKDNELIYSPNVTEIDNTAKQGEEGYGWRFFSDGTAMSPNGEYYKDGQMVWTPYATEEVTSLTKDANLVENTAKEGEIGYGWKYYDNGVAISPDGEYYKNGEVIWSPFSESYQQDTTEIPNTAKEGEEGYGWRYFSDGTKIDPQGNYYNSDDEIVWKYTPESGDIGSKFGSAALDYLKRQFTGGLGRGMVGSLSDALFGSNRGLLAQQALQKAGLQPTYQNLVALGYGDIFNKEEDTAEQEGLTTTADSTSAELFNPVKNMSWAPQTKIGGLGAVGKYINQEGDTYYINKEQEQKQKAEEELQTRGWMTDEEKQKLIEENQQKQYFDLDATEQGAPWWSNQQPVQAAEGGLIDHNPEFYSEGGASLANRYVKGDGDGTSDSVPAMLASGEFVIPADVVSGLGNGDNDAGAQVLDGFLQQIRKHKRSSNPAELPPDSKGPLEYLAQAHKKVGKYGRA